MPNQRRILRTINKVIKNLYIQFTAQVLVETTRNLALQSLLTSLVLTNAIAGQSRKLLNYRFRSSKEAEDDQTDCQTLRPLLSAMQLKLHFPRSPAAIPHQARGMVHLVKLNKKITRKNIVFMMHSLEQLQRRPYPNRSKFHRCHYFTNFHCPQHFTLLVSS